MVIVKLTLILGGFKVEDEVEENKDLLSVLNNWRLLFIELAQNGRKEGFEGRMMTSVLESSIELKSYETSNWSCLKGMGYVAWDSGVRSRLEIEILQFPP